MKVHDYGFRAESPEVITIEDDTEMTPEKVTPPPKSRRMSFPKLNVKKLRAMFAPPAPRCPYQIGGRYISFAKRADEPYSESSEEEDDGSWGGPPVPEEDPVGEEVVEQVGLCAHVQTKGAILCTLHHMSSKSIYFLPMD